MKIKNVMFLLFGGAILFSCNKAELNSDRDTFGSDSKLEARTIILPTITNIQGILAFQDSADVYNAMLYLEDEWNYHNDTFNLHYSSSSDIELDSIADLLNFDEDKTLNDFEGGLSFSSLRDSIESAIDIWLDNTTLVESTYPGTFHIIDPFLQTLLNTRCEIIIDSSIWTFHPNGSATVVYNLNFSVQDSVRQGIFNPDTSPNGRLEFRGNHLTPENDCCILKEEDQGFDESGGFRLRGDIEMRRLPWGSSVLTIARGLRVKTNGKFKKVRSTLTSRSWGEVEWEEPFLECIGEVKTFDKDKTKRRRRLVARYSPWRYFIAHGDHVFGEVEGSNQTSLNFTLLCP